MKADELWTAIKDEQKKTPTFIPPALIADVDTVRSTVLNSLVHAGSAPLTKPEVQFALDTIRKLEANPFR